jgi:hypothetical protein
MNIQFSIQPSDPLRPRSKLTDRHWEILKRPGETIIIERDKDCPTSVLVAAVGNLFPDMYLPCQDRKLSYYRVHQSRKSATWGTSTFSEARAIHAVGPCKHLFRVNRHGEIYLYEAYA